MDGGLLWTVVGSVTGLGALGLTAWQVRLQLLERRERRQPYALAGKTPELAAGGLPVTVPLGRLPAEVRGRDLLLAELRAAVGRRQPGGAGRVWVLAGMGGVSKSTVALAAAKAAVGGGRVPQLGPGPAEHLLEEPEHVFNIEAAQERLPGAVDRVSVGTGTR